MEIHFLKTRMNRGGQFENLLTFFKMPPPPLPPQYIIVGNTHNNILLCLNTIRLINPLSPDIHI